MHTEVQANTAVENRIDKIHFRDEAQGAAQRMTRHTALVGEE